MRRTFKFLHTAGAVGMAGGLAAYLLLLSFASDATSLEAYTSLRGNLAAIARYLVLPSMVMVLLSGLMAMAVHFPFQGKAWVWLKALSGFLIFEGTLMGIDAPAQEAARASAAALAGNLDPDTLPRLIRREWGAAWVLLALAGANVALAIWRPRFGTGKRAQESTSPGVGS